MIQFTQFLRPDGRAITVHIERPPMVESMAEAFIALGGRLSVELMRDDSVSLLAEIDGPYGDVIVAAHEVVANGPQVPRAVDNLICRAILRTLVPKGVSRETQENDHDGT